MNVHNLINLLRQYPTHAEVILCTNGYASCPIPEYCEMSGIVSIDVDGETISDFHTLQGDPQYKIVDCEVYKALLENAFNAGRNSNLTYKEYEQLPLGSN
jgi:hypothetical protein